MSLDALRKRFPFPTEKPNIEQRYLKGKPEGWCSGDNVRMFERIVPHDAKIIIDGGSWMGLSAWHFLRIAPNATVICIDTWKGSEEHQKSCPDILPHLYDIFVANLWEFRDRVIPVRSDSLNGLRAVAHYGLSPDVVYVDWSHDRDSVFADVSTALKLFPDSEICGDDYLWDGVRKATEEMRVSRGADFVDLNRCWKINRHDIMPPDVEKWNAFACRWMYRDCYGAEKYIHWNQQMRRCVALAVSAGLSQTTPKRILDISAGAGVLGHVLRTMGHDVTMTNPKDPQTDIYSEAHAALCFAPAIPHEYTSGVFKKLPCDIGQYEVIISRALTVMSFWGIAVMEEFITDCMTHIIDGGYLLLAPNAFSDETVMGRIKYLCENSVVNSSTYYKIHKNKEG